MCLYPVIGKEGMTKKTCAEALGYFWLHWGELSRKWSPCPPACVHTEEPGVWPLPSLLDFHYRLQNIPSFYPSRLLAQGNGGQWGAEGTKLQETGHVPDIPGNGGGAGQRTRQADQGEPPGGLSVHLTGSVDPRPTALLHLDPTPASLGLLPHLVPPLSPPGVLRNRDLAGSNSISALPGRLGRAAASIRAAPAGAGAGRPGKKEPICPEALSTSGLTRNLR